MKKLRNRLSSQQGFTLIELITTIVIVGIMIAIGLPNFMGAIDNAKVAHVKTSMHVFQTVLETYASDWQGYPDNVFLLQYEANQPGRDYWREIINPFTNLRGGGLAYDNASIVSVTATGILTPDAANAGLVLYDASPIAQYKYFIYGLDRAGNTIFEKGQVFSLSNG